MLVTLAPGQSLPAFSANQPEQGFAYFRSPWPARWQGTPLQVQVHEDFTTTMHAWNDYPDLHLDWWWASQDYQWPKHSTGELLWLNSTALWLWQNLIRLRDGSGISPLAPPPP